MRSLIAPSLFDQVLGSAANAGLKGQAQYLTPPEWAKLLSLPLPNFRPTVLDLSCGTGNLLHGASIRGTKHLLGCDIDPSCAPKDCAFIPADVTRLYSLLREINFQADLFTLNPPWDLHQHRDRLAALATSQLPAVTLAFAAHDGRTSRDTIDSTVATLCLALDLSSYYGEGYLIANESTVQRLILGPNAPHHPLAVHLWAHLVIAGNICQQSNNPSLHHSITPFKTSVLYFAAGHTSGCQHTFDCPDLPAAKRACGDLRANRLQWRHGPEARDYICTEDTAEKWAAVAEEWARLNPASTRPLNNLSLAPDGTIRTCLSLFDRAASRYTQEQAAKLHELQGKHPTQLVLQRAHRRNLEEAAGIHQSINPSIHSPGRPWRVEPALQAAVRQAVADYNAVRAPLYPLSKIQRLGYLDEQDEIACLKSLGTRPLDGSPIFLAGARYPLRSTTVRVQRRGTKVNLEGGLDDVEWNGQELAFFLTDATGAEHVFMEARLRDPAVRVTMAKPGVRELLKKLKLEDSIPCPIDFTLQELAEHFHIPEVPDVASANPQAYERNLALLREIETLTT